MTPNSITILDSMKAVHLDVTIWSARKKLTVEDFGDGAESLPPDELASLGSKRLCPKESLRIFGALKSRAVSILNRTGVKFLGGWLVPDSKADKLQKDIESIAREFEAEKALFLSGYMDTVEAWLNGHSEWRHILENASVSPEYVASRLRFSFHSYKIATSEQDEHFTELVSGIANRLIDETVASAKDIWRDTFEGRSSVTHKALSPLRTLEQKLAGMVFVAPEVKPIMSMIHTALAMIPPKGNIEGAALGHLQGLCFVLRDKNTLLAHAARILEGSTEPEEILVAAPVPAAPVIRPDPAPAIPFINSNGLW